MPNKALLIVVDQRVKNSKLIKPIGSGYLRNEMYKYAISAAFSTKLHIG